MATFAPPAGVVGPTWTTEQVKAQIDVVAANQGVPPALAEAQAQVESGFNPYSRGDVTGGVPTSFGVYQLHHPGELDSLPGNLNQQIAAAYDPATNARVSLSRVAAVYAANPGADPGAIAAAAQRPADPAGYAAKVDAALGNPGGSGSTAAPPAGAGNVQTVSDSSSGSGAFGKGTTTYKLTPVGPSITIWSWPRIAFVMFGSILVLLGLYVTFRGGGSSAVKIDVDKDSSTDDAGATTHKSRSTVSAGRHKATSTKSSKIAGGAGRAKVPPEAALAAE